MATLTMVDPGRADLFYSMHGYNGYGNLPPPVLLNSNWWDEQKITETVNTRYIKQQITDSILRKRLDEPLWFGKGLTESTYCEWIVEHTKKFFLILCDLGCPNYIFDVIDESWDDEDLPLSMTTIERLRLPTFSQSRKFSKKQYAYLARGLEEGHHTELQDEEIVPLEVISRRAQPGSARQTLERVYFPRSREIYYTRRRIPLGDGPNKLLPESFMNEIEILKSIQHDHIVSLHLSYTHESIGYLVLAPCIDLSLKSFIQYPPTRWKSNSKEDRRSIIFNWMHCLSDALAYLYEKGISHCDIKPSSISIESKTNRIFFADIGNSKRLDPVLQAAQSSKQLIPDIEAYDYGAPELWLRSLVTHGITSSPTNTIFSGRTYRRPSDDNSYYAGHRGTEVSQWTAEVSLPSKSDVFSLACIFLEIFSFHSKRKSSVFATHRSIKNRRPRESAPPDSSFHANLSQVDSWIERLHRDARKKTDKPFADGLELCREMLRRGPETRPEPRDVADQLYHTVVGPAVAPDRPHCGMHSVIDPTLAMFGGWVSQKDSSGRCLSASSMGRRSTTTSMSSVSDNRWLAM